MRGVTIHPRGAVNDADRDGAWATYLAAFEPLRSIALQRHLMTRAEFDEWGRPLRETGANGELTERVYDDLGRVTRVRTPG